MMKSARPRNERPIKAQRGMILNAQKLRLEFWPKLLFFYFWKSKDPEEGELSEDGEINSPEPMDMNNSKVSPLFGNFCNSYIGVSTANQISNLYKFNFCIQVSLVTVNSPKVPSLYHCPPLETA